MHTLRVDNIRIHSMYEFINHPYFQITDDNTEYINITFDQLEQLYTWAASIHEEKSDNSK